MEFLNKPKRYRFDKYNGIKALISLSLLGGVLDQSILYFDYTSLFVYEEFFGTNVGTMGIFTCMWFISMFISIYLSLYALQSWHIWVHYLVVMALMIVNCLLGMILTTYSIFLFEVASGLIVGFASGTTLVAPLFILWYNTEPSRKALFTGLYFYFTWVVRDSFLRTILQFVWVGNICTLKDAISTE